MEAEEAALLSAIYTGVVAPAGIATFGTGLTEDQKIASLASRYQRHQPPTDWSHVILEGDKFQDLLDHRPPTHALYDEGSVSEAGNRRRPERLNKLINSSKTPRTMSRPNQGTKRASEVQITSDYTHNKKGKTSVKVNHNKKSVAANTVSTGQTYYDSSLLLSTGEKRLTKLNVKLGKQLYPDVITPFLEQLNQHANVRMQFAGRLVTSAQGIRHNHVQMFRHRLSNSASYNVATSNIVSPWPTLFKKNILLPISTEKFYINGSALDTNPVGAFFPVGKTAFADIRTNQTYYAPYNLADLEDCSWNLNRLKLYPQDWGDASPQAVIGGSLTVPVVAIVKDVQPFQPSAHFRSSFLSYNNSLTSESPGTTQNSKPARYKYKAVIHKGNVCYDFMNKGTGGAKIEVIVYRVKKNQVLNYVPQTDDGATPPVYTADMQYVTDAIAGPIGQGYMDTCLEKQGTEKLNGRYPTADDVLNNAYFPFLPNLKRTKQGDLPFAEVSRQTFAMPSGSRREVQVSFPGLFYDPRSQPMVMDGVTPEAQNATHPSVFDEHSYAIMISVCGVPCTNEMLETHKVENESNGTFTEVTHPYNVGDVISRADVQFYGTYTESLGACAYKSNKKNIMFSAGTLVDNDIAAVVVDPSDATIGGTVVETPVTMLPQSSAARLPATSTGVGGLNLTNDFGTGKTP